MATSTDTLRRRAALRLLVAVLIVNVAVFVSLRLAASFSQDTAAGIISALALHGDEAFSLSSPWSIVTYMFTQYDYLHVMLNMLWLCWFWILLSDAGLSASRIGITYLAGGLAAAGAYLLFAPAGMLLGSSGAVMSIVAATAFAIPGARVDLPLLRPVSVAAASGIIVAISIICMAWGSTGSFAAHAGGIVAGTVSGISLRLRRRCASPSLSPLSNDILDKVRTSGFASLSADERESLLRSSSNDK